jgi:uncharacterized membrane protein YdjX (TVP38/TMEM64 family)
MLETAFTPIPLLVFAVANGYVFGPVIGFVISWTASVIGAGISFQLSRTVKRAAKINFEKPFLVKVDQMVTRNGFMAILVLRLVPWVSSALLNYTAGFTGIRFSTFMAATAVAKVPLIGAFTLLGGNLGSSNRQVALLSLVVLVIAAAVIYIPGLLKKRRSRAVS